MTAQEFILDLLDEGYELRLPTYKHTNEMTIEEYELARKTLEDLISQVEVSKCIG